MRSPIALLSFPSKRKKDFAALPYTAGTRHKRLQIGLEQYGDSNEIPSPAQDPVSLKQA
jgi:hypothetical protein